MTIDQLLIIGAFVCFALSAFGVNGGRVNLLGLGLALGTLSLLI